jgi:CrcB protein
MTAMAAWIPVALGGALGAVARYGLSGWVQNASGSLFPFGTLAVNIGGSLVIGFVVGLGAERLLVPPAWRLFLTTGFCGGFTTFSTFSYETLALIEDHQWWAAGGNALVNVVACLAATLLGLAAARAL